MQIYYNEICADHDMGAGEVEQPARYHAVYNALNIPEFSTADWHHAPQVERTALEAVHDKAHIERLFQFDQQAETDTDSALHLAFDLVVKQHSIKAARTAAGGCVAGIDAICGGETDHAFVIARPPGHHAEYAESMGFCVFNNIVVAAAHASNQYGIERIALLDFDVHHGNGTQQACEDRADWFFASSHQWPLYPGTGKTEERGNHDTIRNMPLPEGTDGHSLMEAWEEIVFPELETFKPQLILISAGFDAHRLDPLGGMLLTEEDYFELTRRICAIADRHANGRILSTLEGGYNLEALANSALAHVRALNE